MNKVSILKIADLKDRTPEHALVANVDLVIVKFDDDISVLYGRCLHRGALMSDGHIDGHNLICGVHGWDYRVDSGVSEYNNKEVLHKFSTKIDGDDLYVDAFEIDAYLVNNPNLLIVMLIWVLMRIHIQKRLNHTLVILKN